MDARFGAEHSSLSTPPLCPLSMPVELRAGTSGSTVPPLCALPAGLRNAPTPSLRSQRCRLVVLALEVGGRWSSKAAQFVRLLARRAVPRPLRPATIAAFTSRWSTFGASLLGLSLTGTANVDGDQPLLSEVLSSTRFDAWTRAWRSLTSPKQRVAAVLAPCNRDRGTPVAKRCV